MNAEIEDVLMVGMKQQFFKLGCFTLKGANKDGSGRLWLGRMAAGITNLSFACELSLKHLYYKEKSRTVSGHELLGLFKKLDQITQLNVKNEYFALCKSKLNSLDCKRTFYMGEKPEDYIQDPHKFDVEIKKYSLAFPNYRYYFESSKTRLVDVKGNGTKYYNFDYRFLYLFFLAVNKFLSDGTYDKHINYYESLKSDIIP